MSKPFPYRMTQLMDAIRAFNMMYKLPLADYPRTAMVADHEQDRSAQRGDPKEYYVRKRVDSFKRTMHKEVAEAEDIYHSLTYGVAHKDGIIACDTGGNPIPYKDIDTLTDLADWLGDMVIYCFSEAAKYGLPMDKILEIIMDSNMSKLGPDGNPIYDRDGKVCKGPYYWKPEPKIKELLESRIHSAACRAYEQSAKEYPIASLGMSMLFPVRVANPMSVMRMDSQAVPETRTKEEKEAQYKELYSYEPSKAPAPSPEDICLWPDGTYCAYELLPGHPRMLEVYEIVPIEQWDVAGGCKK